MKALVAEDHIFLRRLLEQTLAPDYDVIVTQDGDQAWATLEQTDLPQLAILDWIMPVMFTAKTTVADASGFRARADDRVTKPFHREELRARGTIGAASSM